MVYELFSSFLLLYTHLASVSVSVEVFSVFLDVYHPQRLECIASIIKNRFMHAILITEILNTFIKGRSSSYVECSTFTDEFYIIA